MPTFKVFQEFQTPATSLDQGKKNQGLYPSGIYKGFDDMTDGGGPGINIVINHEVTGIQIVGNALALSAKSGVVVTPQGKIIHVTGALDPLLIADNASGNTRTDWVIIEHEHIETMGGSTPTISVIQGDVDGDEPVLSNALKQVLLMKVFIPAGASTFAELSFQRPTPPNFNGNDLLAALNQVQQFTALQAMFKKGTNATLLDVAVDNKIVKLVSDGNYFKVPDGAVDCINIHFIDQVNNTPPEGTVIMLEALGLLTFRDITDDDAYGQGFHKDFGTALQIAVGEVVILRYEGTESTYPRWRILHVSSVPRVLQALYAQVNTGPSSIVTQIASIPDMEDDLTEIFIYLNQLGYLCGTSVTSNTGSVAWPESGWLARKLGKQVVMTFNGTATITGTPTTLYFSLIPLLPNGITTMSGGVEHANVLHDQDGEPIFCICDSTNNRLVLTRPAAATFSGSVVIRGQIIFRSSIYE